MLDADVRELAQGVNLGIFTTIGPDGLPQSSAVWQHADEHHILIGTNTSKQKYRNVARDPRATILILDSGNRRRYIEVRGRIVDIEPGEAALALARTTFTKWTGQPVIRPADGERVILRLEPSHVFRKE